MASFNIELALKGHTVITRDGLRKGNVEVRKRPVNSWVLTAHFTDGSALHYTETGRWNLAGQHDLDLFMTEGE